MIQSKVRLAIITLAAITLSSCSWFRSSEPEIIFDDAQGPKTEDLVRTLPEGLLGDERNRDYSAFPLTQPELEDAPPTPTP